MLAAKPRIEGIGLMEDTEPPQDPPEPAAQFSKEELKRALRAFKKRLKMMRLDDESRLGRGAMTSGIESGVVAITPPNQFPSEIWEALAAQGRLIKTRDGLYELGNP